MESSNGKVGSTGVTVVDRPRRALVTPTDNGGLTVTIDATDDATVNVGSTVQYVTPEDMSSMAHRLLDYLARQDSERQAKEDERSIHRNRNRMLTLIFALFASVVITYVLSNQLLGKWVGTTFGPYSFAITILFDSALTIYAYVKRY